MVFRDKKTTVSVDDDVLRTWERHRQLEAGAPEACGVLIGSTSEDWDELWIESASTPRSGDTRSRFGFTLCDPAHQGLVDDAFESSGGRSIYLGTWHTHPEPSPTPSRIDRNDWAACVKRNDGRALMFAIVGTEAIHLYTRGVVRFRRMREVHG